MHEQDRHDVHDQQPASSVPFAALDSESGKPFFQYMSACKL